MSTSQNTTVRREVAALQPQLSIIAILLAGYVWALYYTLDLTVYGFVIFLVVAVALLAAIGLRLRAGWWVPAVLSLGLVAAIVVPQLG